MTVDEWERRLAECDGDPVEYRELMRNKPPEIPANGIRVGNRNRDSENSLPFLERLQMGGK